MRTGQQTIFFQPLENETLAVVVGVHHPLARKETVKFASLLNYSWILQSLGSPMREVLDQEFRMLQALPQRGLIETASIVTTTSLLAETDRVGVVPQSIADSYAEHGRLALLPCLIEHNMEEFDSIVCSDRPLSEAAMFFLAALHGRSISAA